MMPEPMLAEAFNGGGIGDRFCPPPRLALVQRQFNHSRQLVKAATFVCPAGNIEPAQIGERRLDLPWAIDDTIGSVVKLPWSVHLPISAGELHRAVAGESLRR